MAILDDFPPDTTRKTIRHVSGTTVYSSNALYSALKDFEDDPGNMTHETIMEAQTPTEYTIINGWFIDNPSTHFLNGGAITSIGYANEIQRVVTTDAGTDPVPSDLGLVVTPAGSGTPGILLHFDLDINDDGTDVNAWYVRSGDGTAWTGAMTSSGTGAQTVDTSEDGEEVWTNVFSFGVLTSTVSPQFYIEQILNGSDHRIIEWVANSNFSRGNMDVLIRTQVEGATNGLDELLITIRQPGTSYDSNEQTLNGGRNPFALNAADDPDNLLSEYYFLFDAETGTDFVVGDTITSDSTSWYAEITEVTYFTDTATGFLGLRGLNESIDPVVDNDVFTSSGSGTASVNGTRGDRIIAFDGETDSFLTVGQVVTGAGGTKALLLGVDDNGTDGYLCLGVSQSIDFREDSTYYDLFIENELITGASDGSADVDLATTDLQLGISGMDGKVEIVWHHGELEMASTNLTVGMHVTQVTSGATGIVTDVNGTTIGFGNTSIDFTINTADIVNDDDSGALGTPDNVTAWVDDHTVSKAFQQATDKNYDVVLFLENETVQRGFDYAKYRTGDGNKQQLNLLDLTGAALIRRPVDGQFYLSAYIDSDTPSNTYDKVGKRAAPLGTFAGGTWFTARGIWLEDVNGLDATAFQLIDSDNAVQNPPNFIAVRSLNTISGDYVINSESTGSGLTLVSKTTYNSEASNNAIGTSQFEVDGTPSIRTDTPSDGYIRVTDDSSVAAQTREHRYKYDSFGTVVDEFELTAFTDSTDTGGAGGLVHTNSGRNFTSDGIEVGMMIRNTNNEDIGFISEVGTTTLTVKQLEGPGDGQFDSGDVIEINKLVVAYVAADTAFVPYIDRVATGTTESVTVIYASDRFIVSKVRNKGVIFAFDGTGTVTNTGGDVTTVRTADTIAT